MLCAKLSQEVCVNLDTVTEKNAHRIKTRQNYHAPSAPSRNLNRARILQPLGTAPKVELALSETSACICACTGLNAVNTVTRSISLGLHAARRIDEPLGFGFVENPAGIEFAGEI